MVNTQQQLQQSRAVATANLSFSRLPFYDVLGPLMPSTTLQPRGAARFQEAAVSFTFSLEQADRVAGGRDTRPGSKLSHRLQTQLRFCQVDPNKAEQTDEFPSSVCVTVNQKMCPLPNPVPTNKPNTEPRRPPRPVDITPLVKITPILANTVSVKWAVEPGRNWALGLHLVEKLSAEQLLERLRSRGTRQSQFTKELIKSKLCDDGDDIATTNLKVTLACPLVKMRMNTPCRPSSCDHLQCFDAEFFLQMNERKPTWQCPVCDSPALYDSLLVDGYFLDVIKSPNLPEDENEIILNQDGSWAPLPREEVSEEMRRKEELAEANFSLTGVASSNAAAALDVECIDID